MSSLNYREVDVKSIKPQNIYHQLLFQSDICFKCVKETSQRDVSFTHPKHMLKYTVIEIDHE